MIIPVYIEPQPILHELTEPVIEVTPVLRAAAENMRETMHLAKGIGLAAPQVGINKSFFVMEYDDPEEPSEHIPFTVVINPQILWKSIKKVKIEEGCLSLPGIYGIVKRPEKVTVKYMDIDGKPREMTVEGLAARIVQHEMDHLRGVLFTEYLNKDSYIYREAPEYPRI